MKAEPIKKDIYKKAKRLGVNIITLHFSGGNDEGFLDIDFEPEPEDDDSLRQEVEDWAWETYNYSGAGEGTDYGDDITYNLKENKVETSIWFYTRRDEQEGVNELLVKDDF